MLASLAQYHDQMLLVVRLVVGYIFVFHGMPKIRKPDGMAQAMGWPRTMIIVLGLVEALGGLGVALGVYSQISALALALVMIGAMWTKITKWKVPFYAQNAMGWEYDLILLVVCLFIFVHGTPSYGLMPM